MCGIAGLVEPQGGVADPEILLRMTRALTHRGPDDEGFYLEGRVGLGHRRLAIIDLQGGHQPMSNEAQSVWVVFNGEIYNYVELREELEKQGSRFHTQSDTEVLLRMYEVSGPDCVRRLRGMFAFAIWDQPRQQLLLVRDRLGKKPLYFYQEGERLCFASEFAALLTDDRIPRHLNLTALDEYLTFGYIPSPRTIFEGVAKLPPAHLAIFRDGGLTMERYWEVRFGQKQSLTEAEAAEEFMRRLREAVRIRLRADVPLGVLLSGGIDSSTVTALAAELSSKPLETFTIGFEEESFNELPYAERVAKQFGTAHHEFIVRPDALAALPRLIHHYGEPFGDSSSLPTYYLAHMTRQCVTVALNGDGGDELLAGYDRYYALRLSQKLAWVPTSQSQTLARLCALGARWSRNGTKSQFTRAGRFLEALGTYRSPAACYARWVSIFTPELKHRLYRDTISHALGAHDSWDWLVGLLETSDALDLVEQAMQTDLNSYLPGDLLVKMDIATMAHGLEVRSPFLDHELIEVVASFPVKFKLRGRRTKHLLWRTMAHRVPSAVFHRAKQGFGVPIGCWFRESLRDVLQRVLLEESSVCQEYFQLPVIRALVEEHLSGQADHTGRLWALLMFVLWHRVFLEGVALEELWEAQALGGRAVA